jgi:hypothetical protein
VNPNQLLPWLIAVAMAVIVVLIVAFVFGAF